MIDRDDTLMYTKGCNFLLFDFHTKWVLHMFTMKIPPFSVRGWSVPIPEDLVV
jgi:hypothetical protein